MAMKMNKCATYFIRILELCIVIPLCLLIFIGIIILPILAAPFLLYRFCVKNCAKCFRPDLANILACGNAIMTSYDEVYGRNDNTTVITLKVAGSLDIDQMRSITTEKLINAKTTEGTFKFPELKQYPVKWMGYYFWKPEPNFDIRRHVEYYASPEDGIFYSDEEAAIVEGELVTKAHIKENSPWQIIILPNVKSSPEDLPRSVMFFRTHHGLMDGFALFQLIVGHLGGVDLLKLGIISNKSPNLLITILQKIMVLYRLPYDLAWVVVRSGYNRSNDFRLEHKDLSREQIGTTSLKIPLDYLKQIRKSHRVGLGSVIISSWIGGLRRTMLDRNLKIPPAMHFGHPWFVPGHTGKLRVHASAAPLTLPIGIKDPIERLKAVDDFMKNLKFSSYPLALFTFIPILGSLPYALIDASIPRVPPTGVINIFAATSEPFAILGKQVTELHFSYGQQKFRSSIQFSSLTYSGTVAMKIGINKNIFSNQSDISRMNQFILDELQCLDQQGIVV